MRRLRWLSLVWVPVLPSAPAASFPLPGHCKGLVPRLISTASCKSRTFLGKSWSKNLTSLSTLEGLLRAVRRVNLLKEVFTTAVMQSSQGPLDHLPPHPSVRKGQQVAGSVC